MKTLTVLVPIFNEDRTIQELVRQLEEIQDGVISECIFVNDGSTDSKLELLNDAISTVRFKHQVISQKNGGKASAIHTGAKLVTTSHVIILDSDLELETGDVKVFWKIVTEGRSDIVFGYRKFLAHS